MVAPESEQSAVGHAITLTNPLRVKKFTLDGVQGWAVSGPPADCVKIALAELLPQAPEMVVSGINLGPNVGINVLYSGTVSAATEASILGVRGMAVSSIPTRPRRFCHRRPVGPGDGGPPPALGRLGQQRRLPQRQPAGPAAGPRSGASNSPARTSDPWWSTSSAGWTPGSTSLLAGGNR